MRTEKDRISRELLLVIEGFYKYPGWPRPCMYIESYNFIADSWITQGINTPGNRAYHSLELIGNKVNISTRFLGLCSYMVGNAVFGKI